MPASPWLPAPRPQGVQWEEAPPRRTHCNLISKHLACRQQWRAVWGSGWGSGRVSDDLGQPPGRVINSQETPCSSIVTETGCCQDNQQDMEEDASYLWFI